MHTAPVLSLPLLPSNQHQHLCACPRRHYVWVFSFIMQNNVSPASVVGGPQGGVLARASHGMSCSEQRF